MLAGQGGVKGGTLTRLCQGCFFHSCNPKQRVRARTQSCDRYALLGEGILRRIKDLIKLVVLVQREHGVDGHVRGGTGTHRRKTPTYDKTDWGKVRMDPSGVCRRRNTAGVEGCEAGRGRRKRAKRGVADRAKGTSTFGESFNLRRINLDLTERIRSYGSRERSGVSRRRKVVSFDWLGRIVDLSLELASGRVVDGHHLLALVDDADRDSRFNRILENTVVAVPDRLLDRFLGLG